MVIEGRNTDILTDPKAVLNRTAGCLLLAYSAPLMAIIAAAVALEKGNGSILVNRRGSQVGAAALWRFRTIPEGDCSESVLGGILKRTRMEFLPQLVNVARGDITIANTLR